MRHSSALALALLVAGLGATACGLAVQAPDLFLLERTGQGRPLRLLVNDAGMIRCDGTSARPISDPLLLRARDLATALDGDARRSLHLASAPDSVFR